MATPTPRFEASCCFNATLIGLPASRDACAMPFNKKQLQTNIGNLLWQVCPLPLPVSAAVQYRKPLWLQLEQLEATVKDYEGDQQFLQQRL